MGAIIKTQLYPLFVGIEHQQQIADKDRDEFKSNLICNIQYILLSL